MKVFASEKNSGFEEYITRSESVAKKGATPFTREGPLYFLLSLFLYVPSMWDLPSIIRHPPQSLPFLFYAITHINICCNI